MQAFPQRMSPTGQTQLPPVQAAVVGHAFVQLPQCCGSVAKFTHAVGEPAGHLFGRDVGHWHVLAEQISPASGQTLPQAPQFEGSFAVFTQAVGEATGHCVGSEGGQPHTPERHASCVSGHAFPQADGSVPQFRGSVDQSVQNAVQSSGFAPPHAQPPAWQVEPGFVAAQDVVHEPHAPASVCRSRQRGARLSQRVVPTAHWQTPPAHVAPAPQTTPHAPQFSGSVW